MKKIATVAVLALSASSVMGACGENWITREFSISNTGTAANGDNTFATCASIIGGASTCCTSAVIDTFQDKADQLVEALKTAVSKRDQFILDRRGDVLSVRESLNSIQASITKLAGENAGASFDVVLDGFLGSYETMITSFTEDFSSLKEAFVTYQKDRVTCFNKLVQAQVSLWCAACLDDPSTQGLDTAQNSIAYGSIFTDALAEACSPYITSAIVQSQILSLYYISDYLATLASALEKLANGDTAGAMQELTELFTNFEATVPNEDLEKAAVSVGVCTTSDCSWLANSLFNGGILSNDLAVVGGALSASQRVLQEEVPAGRMLQQFNQDPADEAVGITIEFPENPGDVNNDQNSAVRNSVIACSLTALAALL